MKADEKVTDFNECGKVVVVAETGDILRFTSFFRWGTIEARMVAFWQFTSILGAEPTEAFLAEWFHGQMGANVWSQVGASAAQMYRTVCDNLTSAGMAYGDYLEDNNGGKGDTPLPSFNAVSVKQVVASRETRAGYKRIPFVTEAINVGGIVTIDSDEREAIEDFYGTTLTAVDAVLEEDVGLLAPIVVGRTNMGTEEEPIYELDLTKINLVQSAVVQQKLTSQTSRKT